MVGAKMLDGEATSFSRMRGRQIRQSRARAPWRRTELEPPPPSSQKHAPEAHILAPVAEAVAAAEVAP